VFLLSARYSLDGIGIKTAVNMVMDLKCREPGRAPIVIAIGRREIGARRNGHMFVAHNARILVSIMDDKMTALF
jgi:hypothetical protein